MPMITDENRRRAALGLAGAWIVLDVLSALSLFVAGFSAIVLVGALVALAAAAGTVYAVKRFLVDDERSLYHGARKWFGYANVGAYAALAIPLADRREAAALSTELGLAVYVLIAMSTLAGAALWFLLRAKKSQLFWGAISQAEAEDPKLLKERQRKTKRGILGSALEWVDAAAWAVIVVIVFQRLFLQLYAIPSESMVPTLLIGDRPVIAKFLDAPTFPFAPASFPRASKLERGTVGVFDNPALEQSPPAFRFLQEIVFYLTFSNVDLDKGPDGQPKVSRLIKRCIGVGGDKLMMVDDALFLQRQGETDWKPAPKDDVYSHVDLNGLPANVKAKIRNIPIDAGGIAILHKWDAVKNSADAAALAADLAALKAKLAAAFAESDRSGGSESFLALLRIARAEAEASYVRASAAGPAPWRYASEPELDPIVLAHFVAAKADRDAYLASFAAPAGAAPDNRYAKDARILDLLVKKSQARRLLALLGVARGGDKDAAMADYKAAFNEAAEFKGWLSLYDFRNFPPFPADGYIPAGKYFFMGDNRYNSVDCRFDAMQAQRMLPFDASDPASALRESMLSPRLIDQTYVLGRATLRLFPFTRIGWVK